MNVLHNSTQHPTKPELRHLRELLWTRFKIFFAYLIMKCAYKLE